jgi:hypothetical protein
MVRRFIVCLLALCFAQAAFAQSIGGFNVPSDLTSQPGGGYSAVPPVLDTTNSAHNVNVDPNITPMPVTSTQLTNIPIPSDTGRVFTNGTDWAETTGTGTGCTSFGLVLGLGGDTGCTEAKVRFHFDFSHYAADDPIRNARLPGSSHIHCFGGNGTTNAFSTTKSLRQHALTSTATGTDANATGYWWPCIISTNYYGDGVSRVVKPDSVVLYYQFTANTAALVAHTKKQVLIPVGLRYVTGFNMDDGHSPEDTTHADKGAGQWYQDIVDTMNAANAASGGSSTRYRLQATSGSKLYATQAAYTCSTQATVPIAYQGSNGTTSSMYFVAPDGSDPWGGQCEAAKFDGSISGSVLTVTNVISGTMQWGQGLPLQTDGGLATSSITSQLTSTEPGGTLGLRGTYQLSTAPAVSGAITGGWAIHDFFVTISGPHCYDGTNLWSPGGYKHVTITIYDSKYGESVCPTNYYFIPSFQLHIHYTQYGHADRSKWDLSSDAGARTRLSCTKTGTGNNVCPPGFSFHTDWMDGWDHNIMNLWLQECLGAMNNNAHQCGVPFISHNKSLVGDSVATLITIGANCGAATPPRCPQINPAYTPRVLSTDPGWGAIPSSWQHSITNRPVHGMNDNMPTPVNDNQTKLAGVQPVHFDLRSVGR